MNEEQLKNVLNEQLAQFFGDMTRHVDKRIDELRDELSPRVDHLQTALDAILKNQETEQQERAAINRQLNRHERWHHQTAEHVGLKLDYGEVA